ncbi:ribosomal protein L7/L12 [Sphaerisporangium fuscum]|uniref:ribosomal protein L7/L12 n=1 Tax=Sphaerisporangium fuscum TaxID=2835868 RepID=UPI001BDC816E|nr:ribosomal protein L7/L12 [Sphaerisporangium fuscum]
MANIGLPELIFIAAMFFIGLPVAIIVIVTLARRGSTPQPYVSAWQDQPTHPIPGDLQGQAHALAAQGRKIEAIKLVRQRTGFGLKQAKDYVDALEAGRIPLTPAPPRDDLATRVRRLKSEGRTEQAVFLVRGETGMNEPDAQAFVDQL